MSAMDHVSLLEWLVIAGERAVMQRAAPDGVALFNLREAIVREYNVPTDAARVIGEHTRMLADALVYSDVAVRRYDAAGAARYARVAGVLLPDIRADLLTAIEQRKRPTP